MAHALRALLVGIDHYAGGLPALRGCVADAVAVAHFLTSRLGVPPNQLRMLTGNAATRQAILAGWQEHLVAQAGPGTQLFFHFSGHGSQLPSIDPDEPDALDETLVAYDSRLPGNGDILDKELGYLIRAAEARGAQVSVLLDCCHSGSGTRRSEQPAIRRVAPQADAPAALVVAPATLLDALAQPTAHVLLSAAQDDEAANELYLPDGAQWHGAATYFFLETLRGYHPAMTWRDVHDQVLTRVHARFPRQTPQLAGPAGRLLFGPDIRPEAPYLHVMKVEAERFLVDGGAAVGLAVGAVLAVQRQGAAPGSRPATLATVETLAAGEAWARPEQPAVVEQGSRALILSYGYQEQRHWVAVDDLRLATRLTPGAVEGTSSFLRLVVDDSQVPEFAVRTTPAGYRIEDATGQAIGAPVPGTAEGAAMVVERLEQVASFRNVLALHNPAAAARLADALQVDWPDRVEGRRCFHPGDHLVFTLSNRTSSTCYVTVFRLGADYSITRIKPEAERNQALAPGRAGRIRVSDLVGPLPEGELWGWQRYKIFVTTERMDLDVLQLPALGQGSPQAPPRVRSDSPLDALLDAVRRTGARPMRPPGATHDDKWYTLELEVEVLAPGQERAR